MTRLRAYLRPRLVLVAWLAVLGAPPLHRLPPAAHAAFDLLSPVLRGRLGMHGFLDAQRRIIDDGGYFQHRYCSEDDNCNICGHLGNRFLRSGNETGRATKFYPNDAIPTISLQVWDNDGGYFQFRLCKREKDAQQKCFDDNMVKINTTAMSPDMHKRFQVTEDDTKFWIPPPYTGDLSQQEIIEIPVIWPKALKICKFCMLQTTYYPDNSDTLNEGGYTCGYHTDVDTGCGKVRTVRACSDIAISKHHGKFAKKEALRKWFLNENGTLDYDETYSYTIDLARPIDEQQKENTAWMGHQMSTPGYWEPTMEPVPAEIAKCACKCPDVRV